MLSPAEHINASFAEQVRSFAAELDQRAGERFPSVLSRALEARGAPRESLSPREAALVDALLAAVLEVMVEVVGLAMRRSADLVAGTLAEARVGFPDRDTGR